jgi:glycerophosphoryl diester phosphodiesterase
MNLKENGVTRHCETFSESPEKTLAAFENAILLRADWIELEDLHTQDG